MTALREFVEYAVENTPERPGGGNVYGSFIQRYTGGQDFLTVYEMPNAGAYEQFTAARRQLIQERSAARHEMGRAVAGMAGPLGAPVLWHHLPPTRSLARIGASSIGLDAHPTPRRPELDSRTARAGAGSLSAGGSPNSRRGCRRDGR